jgi:GDP-L-fucose synthase
MDTLTNRKIIVTGGDGFLGIHVVQELQDRGVKNVFVPRSKYYDLSNTDHAVRLLRDYPPDIIIHLAASCPLSRESDRRLDPEISPDHCMCNNILAAAQMRQVLQIVAVWDYHAYPSWCHFPLAEEEVENLSEWEKNGAGGSREAICLQEVIRASGKGECNVKIQAFIAPELYGPGDQFHAQGHRRLPSTIRMISDAKERQQNEVTIPGHPDDTIDFLHVCDIARGIVAAIEKETEYKIMNLASGKSSRWGDVVDQISEYLDYHGGILYSESDRNPDQSSLKTDRAHNQSGFEPTIDLETGLKDTVRWFCTHRRFILENEIDSRVDWSVHRVL